MSYRSGTVQFLYCSVDDFLFFLLFLEAPGLEHVWFNFPELSAGTVGLLSGSVQQGRRS